MSSRFLAAALLLVAGACESKFDPRKKLALLDAGVATSALPAGFRLDLPTARIVVKRPETPEQYPDGTYSVHGLLARKTELLGKEVRVSAYVVELHAPKKPKCPPCTPPHLYLADAAKPADDAPRLLVADFEPQQAKELKTGERQVFSGNFQTTSLSRFVRTEGLLSFKETPK